MTDSTERADIATAAQQLQKAHENVHSNPIKVVNAVRRLETLLGEWEPHVPQSDWDKFIRAIELVEQKGAGDVDFDELEMAVSEVRSQYDSLVEEVL